MNIEELRNTEQWTSFGKLHKGPARTRVISQLSDSHLLHIIEWIKTYPSIYKNGTLLLMEAEAKYRVDNYIFVKEYTDE